MTTLNEKRASEIPESTILLTVDNLSTVENRSVRRQKTV